MSYLSFIKRRFSISPDTIWSDITSKKDPDEFNATGSQVYHGRQRQGKTLSMVNDFHRLKRRFPKTFVISNVVLNYRVEKEKRTFLFIPYSKEVKKPFKLHEVVTLSDLKSITERDDFKSGEWQKANYIYYRSYDTLIVLLKNARNGSLGVHFMIDEIHQYFHSHDSKSMPVWVAQIFSQQMKQYILITATVQKWPNVIKALREQIAHLILCTRRGWRIRQIVIDPEDIENEYGEETAPIKKTGGFFMSRLVRESYDTLALIESGREVYGGGDTQVIKVAGDAQKPRTYARRRAAVR